jgi:hypothetical protein
VDEVAQRHRPREAELTKVASWWHTDGDLGRPIEAFADMTKNRKAGFGGCASALDSFARLFRTLFCGTDRPCGSGATHTAVGDAQGRTPETSPDHERGYSVTMRSHSIPLPAIGLALAAAGLVAVCAGPTDGPRAATTATSVTASPTAGPTATPTDCRLAHHDPQLRHLRVATPIPRTVPRYSRI